MFQEVFLALSCLFGAHATATWATVWPLLRFSPFHPVLLIFFWSFGLFQAVAVCAALRGTGHRYIHVFYALSFSSFLIGPLALNLFLIATGAKEKTVLHGFDPSQRAICPGGNMGLRLRMTYKVGMPLLSFWSFLGFAMGNAEDWCIELYVELHRSRFNFGLKMALLQTNVSEPRIHVTPGAFRTFCSWSSGTPRLVKTALRDASCWEHGESPASSEIPQDAHLVAWEPYFPSYNMISRLEWNVPNYYTHTDSMLNISL